jgi:hypothetical protein
MKALRIIGTIILAAIPATANDVAGSFREAVVQAEAQETAAGTRDYFSRVLLPYYGQKYAPVLQSCFARVPQPDGGAFSFVAAIGPDGRVVRFYDDHETNISRCLSEAVKVDVFPTPPQSPYYLHIDMKFDDAPARPNGSAESAPPLIVGADKYSYTFGVPQDWEFSFEQAHQRGADLAFFPKGGSFNDSGGVVYVNEIGDPCSASDCLSPISQSIANTLRLAKEDSPTVEISTAEPIKTKDGGKAPVRILRGARDPRNTEFKDNEALAFIAHDETIILVVFSSREPKTWKQDYSAFEEIVGGHKFFTCNSPDLAVHCKR